MEISVITRQKASLVEEIAAVKGETGEGSCKLIAEI